MLSLKSREWREFVIEDIFNVISGKDIVPLVNNGNIPYVNSSGINNGVTAYVKVGIVLVENVITIARTGTVGATFYQSQKTYISGNIRALKPKAKELNRHIAQFIITTFKNSVHDIFSYGMILGTERIKRQKILLPVSRNGNPDWRFMDNYIRDREFPMLEQYCQYIGNVEETAAAVPFETKEWGEFYILDFFRSKRGKEGNMVALKAGKLPLISAKKIDNGLKAFVEVPFNRRHDGHAITLNNDGDGGAGLAYYQPSVFALDTHVTLLRPKLELSKFILVFISAAISKQKESFGHGYAISDRRLNYFKVMLPITEDGSPDWGYMDQYAKSLMAGQLKAYLSYSHKKLIES